MHQKPAQWVACLFIIVFLGLGGEGEGAELQFIHALHAFSQFIVIEGLRSQTIQNVGGYSDEQK